MHIQTHILLGWNVGNLFRISPRERFFCMLAASLEDIDGLGIIISQELYWDYHHVLTHGIFFCLFLPFFLAIFSEHKLKSFFLYLVLAHLHLLMDLLGSGELWSIAYFWPLSGCSFESPVSWPLFSWQNILFAYFLVFTSIMIVFLRKRTPLEYIMPALDGKIVAFAQSLFGEKENKDPDDSS